MVKLTRQQIEKNLALQGTHLHLEGENLKEIDLSGLNLNGANLT